MKQALILALTFAASVAAQDGSVRTSFEVRYVGNGSVYVNGGRDDGLTEGFHLKVQRLKPGDAQMSAVAVGELLVTAVAAHSAVCQVQGSAADLKVGDMAILSQQDTEILQATMASKTMRHFAQVVSFAESDPLEEEMREYVPKPRLPEVNRIRARISFEQSMIRDHDSGTGSSQEGIVVRADMTRIGGSYWNFTGYWRGRFDSHTSGVQNQTITDLLNRTYHIGMYYNNPSSKWVMGFGRLLVPWASSLSTVDGGYIGRRLTSNVILAAFAGSTPDPTAWNYDPRRQMAGSLINFEVGDWDKFRWSSTSGVALTRLAWKAEREFAFFENNLSYKRSFSVYHNLEADRLTPGRLGNTDSGIAIARSFLTARYQPLRWLTLDVNHNHFRNVPTFDTRLLGTGLLDRLIFQGLSGGVRVDLPQRISLYGSVGRNKRNDEGKAALNQLYGITFANVFDTHVRADFRASRFDSNFGRGAYRSVTVSREITDRLRVELQGGQQEYSSALSAQHRTFWMNSSVDWFLGRHYFVSGGLSMYRGKVQSYDQIYFSLGYSF